MQPYEIHSITNAILLQALLALRDSIPFSVTGRMIQINHPGHPQNSRRPHWITPNCCWELERSLGPWPVICADGSG